MYLSTQGKLFFNVGRKSVCKTCVIVNTFSRQNDYMRLVNAFILTTQLIQWMTISIHNEALYAYIKYFDSYVQRIEIIVVLLSTNIPFKMIFLAELKSGLIDMTLIILTTSIIYVVWLRESWRERKVLMERKLAIDGDESSLRMMMVELNIQR